MFNFKIVIMEKETIKFQLPVVTSVMKPVDLDFVYSILEEYASRVLCGLNYENYIGRIKVVLKDLDSFPRCCHGENR